MKYEEYNAMKSEISKQKEGNRTGGGRGSYLTNYKDKLFKIFYALQVQTDGTWKYTIRIILKQQHGKEEDNFE